MNKKELCALLEKIGVHPSRRLGQNFLVDQNLLEALVKAAHPARAERILEIGPGTGVMTRALLDRGVRLQAVEFDHRLAEYLRTDLGNQPGFSLLEADACKVDYDELMGTETYRCIANLPYSCGSIFLMKIAFAENRPEEMFVLLQKEMGERLVAEKGSKEYGALTVRLSWLYETSVVRMVPPGVFFPPPEITSVFLKLSGRKSSPGRALLQEAGRMVLTAFAQRRKKVFRLLAGQYPEDLLRQAFSELGLTEDMRAEHIGPEQYLKLAEYFLPMKNNSQESCVC